MPEITRALTPADLTQFLASSRYATVAWAVGDLVTAQPAAFHFSHGNYGFGLPTGELKEGTEVTLVVDAGPHYFDLRGVRVRGRAERAAAPGEGTLEGFHVQPNLEVAWHYGRMRER